MKRGEDSLRFPCVEQGVWDLSFSFIVSEMAELSACGVILHD